MPLTVSIHGLTHGGLERVEQEIDNLFKDATEGQRAYRSRITISEGASRVVDQERNRRHHLLIHVDRQDPWDNEALERLKQLGIDMYVVSAEFTPAARNEIDDS